MRLLVGAVLAVVLAAAGQAAADPVEDSLAAIQRRDFAAAFKLIQPVAEAGNARAQYILGLLYLNGQGVTQDYGLSLTWGRKSAEQGFPPGRDQMVNNYLNGRALPQDYGPVAKTCLELAVAGQVKGQECLGFMYLHGDGVALDGAQALLWFKKASDQGSSVAETALGSAFQYGRAVPQDFAQAVYWYGRAADRGNAFGMMNLGGMASKGQGGPSDEVEAYKWADLAVSRFPAWANQAQGLATKNRDLAAGRLTPEQLAQAKSRVAAWRTSHGNLPPP
jgi:TPR repeat protein